MKGLAFFDFDNTVIHGDVGPLFGAYLVQDRFEAVRRQDGRKAARKDQALLMARYMPFATWMGLQTALYKTRAVRRSQLVRSAYKALKGVQADRYYERMDAFVEEQVVDRIYPEMAAVMADHQANDRECVIVTTGAQELCQRAARHLPGEVEVIGCRLEEKDGRFTGRVDGPLYGADKANIISAYAMAADIDRADCWAYSDHYSDYHMLEAVGHPVCVNPRTRLLKLAQSRGWSIMTPNDPREAA